MAGTKARGIVVSSKDYKDKDKLIELFTLEQGLRRCIMRGVRGERAKRKAGKEIFCFADYVIEPGKGYDIITEVDIIDNFFGLTVDLDAFYEGCALLDVTRTVASENPEPALFLQLLKALKVLCYGRPSKYYVIDKFLIHVLEGMGYFFLSTICSACSAVLAGKRYLNLQLGDLVCPACRNDTCLPISEGVFRVMQILSRTDYEKLPTIRFADGSEANCYALLSRNFEWRSGHKLCQM